MQAAGYLFVELYVVDLAHYKAIFRDALGFEVIEDDKDFVKLRSQHGTVLLNATTALPGPIHSPTTARMRGAGTGSRLALSPTISTAARQASLAIPGCVVTEVTHQEWGMSDFRILSREGYFFRVTTPDPEP